ncbi:MAG: VWA domain-containing protein [Chloroflexi bacterium]|nr:VWA domain-containing protein [Chloroflexota bacterium]
MFVDFFFTLRKHKVPVSLLEWMTLMEALDRGYAFSSLTNFYHLARSILVKSETHYDAYDVAFKEYFEGIETPEEISDQVLDWLNDPVRRLELSPEQLARLDRMSFEELLKTLEERLREQKERHDGGSKWIGTGGTSPFGHSGRNPSGIRIGNISLGGRSALQVASERSFRNYRSDVVLDVRQMKVALKRLRHLARTGPKDQLALPETIDATCQNAGELEFIWESERRNRVKVLLIMDVGGSMDPFATLCSRLFTAAHSATHFKDFKYYYFHNCIYGNLYPDIERRRPVGTDHVLKTLDPDYKLILVGDAQMAPSELTYRNGAIDYWDMNDTPGIVWLQKIADHFTHRVWLNPESSTQWEHPTVYAIGKLFPMFELTLDGLDRAVRQLVVNK